MKTRHILLALAVFAFVSTGIVWATGTTTDTQTPAVDVNAAPAQAAETLTADELLESFVPEAEDKGACCVADCFDEWAQCVDGCNGDPNCMGSCRQDLTQCRASC